MGSSQTNPVLRYDGSTGEFLNVAARDTSLVQPIGLRIGPDGLLYVVSSRARKILRFEPDSGELAGTFAKDSMAFPSDLVFGPGGYLYVSNAGRRSVVRFDRGTGDFVDVVARLPEGGGPVGLDFDDSGRLVIADFLGNRLFRLKPDGGELELLSESGLAGPENLVIRR